MKELLGRAIADPETPPGAVSWSIPGQAPAETTRVVLEDCSVVVCTRNRPAAVRAFLESLGSQSSVPKQLLVIDASEGEATERIVRVATCEGLLAGSTRYFRGTVQHRGLTRQRNLALRLVITPLVGFFDDDVILDPECLGRMVNAHREGGLSVVGVGAYIDNERIMPSLLWRVRRVTGIVSTLKPGRYCRSGLSTPWGFLAPTDSVVPGDWLPGCAMMWRSDLAREVGFPERFTGYGSGEDLDFSLRMAQKGRLLVAGTAHAVHLKDPGGRPDGYETGHLGSCNHYHTHRFAMPDRRSVDAAWFVYATVMDAAIRAIGLLRPAQSRWTWDFLRGRFRFLFELLRERLPVLPDRREETARCG